MRIGIGLDQDLSNANGATAVTQSLLHGLSRSDDGHAAVAGAILQSLVNRTGGRLHIAMGVGQLVERLLDDQPDETVGIELEVTARGVPGG